MDGTRLELFDVRNPDGTVSGIVRERGVVHSDGSPHATSHVWIVRKNQKSGFDVLLQKRSKNKDSNPGCYDISSAGHVAAGDDYLESAVRELGEELGIYVKPEELKFAGMQNRVMKRCVFMADRFMTMRSARYMSMMHQLRLRI